jgi:hypothetical protein
VEQTLSIAKKLQNYVFELAQFVILQPQTAAQIPH